MGAAVYTTAAEAVGAAVYMHAAEAVSASKAQGQLIKQHGGSSKAALQKQQKEYTGKTGKNIPQEKVVSRGNIAKVITWPWKLLKRLLLSLRSANRWQAPHGV
jgi:hypothetical protein